MKVTRSALLRVLKGMMTDKSEVKMTFALVSELVRGIERLWGWLVEGRGGLMRSEVDQHIQFKPYWGRRWRSSSRIDGNSTAFNDNAVWNDDVAAVVNVVDVVVVD